MTPSGGTAIVVRFTKDAAVVDVACTVSGLTEHLISLDVADEVSVPNLGAMVEFEIGRRAYRSTVQQTALGRFSVLRPRELDHVAGALADVRSIGLA